MSRPIATAARFSLLQEPVRPKEPVEITEFRANVHEVLETEEAALSVEAQAIIAFVRSDEFGGTGEYVENLKAVFSGTTVSDRNVGLAISAISAYNRHLGRVAERAAKAEMPASEWRGAVGDKKHEIVGTVSGVRLIESQYGTTVLYTFQVGTDTYKWFSSNSKGWKEGDAVHLTGTIKAHDEYKGTKSTVLTRCREV